MLMNLTLRQFYLNMDLVTFLHIPTEAKPKKYLGQLKNSSSINLYMRCVAMLLNVYIKCAGLKAEL